MHNCNQTIRFKDRKIGKQTKSERLQSMQPQDIPKSMICLLKRGLVYSFSFVWLFTLSSFFLLVLVSLGICLAFFLES